MYSLTDLQPASLAFLLNSSTSASVTRGRITVERTVDGSGVLVLIDFDLLLGIRNFRFFQKKYLDDSDQTVRSYRSPTLQSQDSLPQKDSITGEQMNNLIFIHTTIILYASGSNVLARSLASRLSSFASILFRFVTRRRITCAFLEVRLNCLNLGI